jgi:hypothetical protein
MGLAALAGRVIFRLMADLKFYLRPVERKDGTWCVEITKIGIIPESIGDFQSEADANDWITEESLAFFQKRAKQ